MPIWLNKLFTRQQDIMSEQKYDQAFYDSQMSGSYQSALVYLKHLFQYWHPESVIDMGCGRGMWLAACRHYNVPYCVGLDGHWNSQDKMVDQSILFRQADLNEVYQGNESFDLAMSLEVAEHVQPESSGNFVASLTGLSDVVMFGAAYSWQPGTDHINTRPHSFWFRQFIDQGYVMFDLFRPFFWSDNKVEPWYRQNTFLYVKRSHKLVKILESHKFEAVTNPQFVDCIHPWLYEWAMNMVFQLQSQQRSVT